MIQSRALFAVIFLALAFSLKGQGEFKPGYIIDLNQDTIYGEIKGNSASQNAQICEFRTGNNAETSEFFPGEIQAYRFTPGKYYVSMKVEADGEQKLAFVEYLVNGIANLYYLRDQNTEHYYIQKEGEDALAINNIRLLKAAFSDCLEIQSSLDKATLTHNSLISMTEKYHNYVCDGEACIVYNKEASRVRVHVMPYLGYSMKSLIISGSTVFDLLDFELSKAPVFGIALNLASNRLGSHLSFQLGAEFSKQSYQGFAERLTIVGDTFTYDAHLEASMISFQFGTRYTVSGNRVRTSFGGGLQYSKFINPNFYYVENKYSNGEVFTSTWSDNPVGNPLFGAYLQLGLDVMLSKRLVLASAFQAGFLTSNPNILAGGIGEQIRLTPGMIPITIRIGIQF